MLELHHDPSSSHLDGDGCSVFPVCLECPLPVCRFDDPGASAREAKRRKWRQIAQAFLAERAAAKPRRGGKPEYDAQIEKRVAEKLGVSFRVVQRARYAYMAGELEEPETPQIPNGHLLERRYIAPGAGFSFIPWASP